MFGTSLDHVLDIFWTWLGNVQAFGVGVDAATGSIWPQVRPEHEVPNKGV